MTQLNISLEEAKKLSELVIDFIGNFDSKLPLVPIARNLVEKPPVGPRARIMGGFVRDSAFGRPVKDMDVYIDTPHNWKEEQMDALAKAFYEDRDHKYIRHDKGTQEGVREEEAQMYHRALWVYSSVDVSEGDFPVDLIFVPGGSSHSGHFDVALCECVIGKGEHEGPRDERGRRTWVNGVYHKISPAAQNDFDNKQITVQRVDDVIMEELRNWRELSPEEFNASYTRLLGHISRIKAKYPDFRVCVNPDYMNLREMKEVYTRLKEDGIFGEAREILQAQAEGIDWNEVRQLDRETALRFVGEQQREREEARIQATFAALQGGAPVQPGFLTVDEWQWNTQANFQGALTLTR